MASEEWSTTTEAQARELAREYGASPDEVEREITRDYRGAAWYWSPERALVSVYDGQTTVADLSDAMARGPLDERQEAMAADFWVMAAQHANTTASNVQAAASATADTEGTTQSLAAFLAADDAAGVAGQVLSDLQGRAEELNQVADAAADERTAEVIARTTATREVYEVLVDRAYADSVDNNTGRQDDYLDQTWQLAAELAGSRHTAADVKRMEQARLADEVSFERAMIDAGEAASEPAPSWYLDRAWETAVGVEQDEANIKTGYDNLGLPEVWEAQRTVAVDFIARETGVPTGFVQEQVSHAVAENAVEAPNWHDMTDWYAAAETFDGPDAGEVGVEEVTDDKQLTVDDDPVLGADEPAPVVVTEAGEAALLTGAWDTQAQQMRAGFEAITPAEHLAAATAADSLAEELGELADWIEAGLVDDPKGEAARAEAVVAAYWTQHGLPSADLIPAGRVAVAEEADYLAEIPPEVVEQVVQTAAALVELDLRAGEVEREAYNDQLVQETGGGSYADASMLLGYEQRMLDSPRANAADEGHCQEFRDQCAAADELEAKLVSAQDGDGLDEQGDADPAAGGWQALNTDQPWAAGDDAAAEPVAHEAALAAQGAADPEPMAEVARATERTMGREDLIGAEVAGINRAGINRAEIDRLEAELGATRQDLAEGRVRAEDEHYVAQRIEHLEESLAMAAGQWPFGGGEAREAAYSYSAGGGEYPQEYSVADPDESGLVPPEFVTGEDTSLMEESYPALWDAYRSGRPDEDAATRHGDEWEWAYPYTDTETQVGGESPGRSRVAEAVAAAHAAVEADGQRVAEELGEQEPAPYAGGRPEPVVATAEQASTMVWGV